MAIIYLAATLLLQSCCLPSCAISICIETFERAALKRRCTWHYSTQGLPAIGITTKCCELLPHIFTFFSNCFEIVIFCGTVSFLILLKKPALNRCVALCCPDFPLQKNGAIAWLIENEVNLFKLNGIDFLT